MSAPADSGSGILAPALSSAPISCAASAGAKPVTLEIEDLLGDPGLLALHTRAMLAEIGLSYREQESRTGVSASAVYAMAQGQTQRCHLFSVRRFAAFAAHRIREGQAQAYWRELSDRLERDEKRRLSVSVDAEAPEGLTSAEIAAAGAFAAALRSAAGRDAALILLRAALGGAADSQNEP